MEPSKRPAKQDGNILEQHIHTIPTSCAILAMNNVIQTKWHIALSINIGVLENHWRIVQFLG